MVRPPVLTSANGIDEKFDLLASRWELAPAGSGRSSGFEQESRVRPTVKAPGRGDGQISIQRCKSTSIRRYGDSSQIPHFIPGKSPPRQPLVRDSRGSVLGAQTLPLSEPPVGRVCYGGHFRRLAWTRKAVEEGPGSDAKEHRRRMAEPPVVSAFYLSV
jgi:hypothetical protein